MECTIKCINDKLVYMENGKEKATAINNGLNVRCIYAMGKRCSMKDIVVYFAEGEELEVERLTLKNGGLDHLTFGVDFNIRRIESEISFYVRKNRQVIAYLANGKCGHDFEYNFREFRPSVNASFSLGHVLSRDVERIYRLDHHLNIIFDKARATELKKEIVTYLRKWKEYLKTQGVKSSIPKYWSGQKEVMI